MEKMGKNYEIQRIIPFSMENRMNSKNIQIKIHGTLILSAFCMGVKRGLSHKGRNIG
jgi:hypothetical protein